MFLCLGGIKLVFPVDPSSVDSLRRAVNGSGFQAQFRGAICKRRSSGAKQRPGGTFEPPLRINFRSALLLRSDRCRIPAFHGFVLYAMARLEAGHLALPKCQATTIRRHAANRRKFHQQIDRPKHRGGHPSNQEHAGKLRDNVLCRCKGLVYVPQLLIEIIRVSFDLQQERDELALAMRVRLGKHGF